MVLRILVMALAGLQVARADQQSTSVYGRELAIVADMGVGGCMDAAIEGPYLFAIGGGKLYTADLSAPARPRVVGRLSGLGQVRQIAVRNGVAYVTAREDGLLICDVRRPERPMLLAHYDTIELATGIALSGDVAFVACRQCGVELIDVRDPARPVHLSTVRPGEAQSVVARDGYLYVGVWGTSELVVCDVQNPHKPRVVGRAPLDGYGDGIALRGKYCYVATGHHSRADRLAKDPAGGHGHGLEVFDVSEPQRPRFVARIKMPRFYRIGMDMWGVELAGRYAFVADTHNGVFVIDVADPANPRCVAHRQLAHIEKEGVSGPAAGLAVGQGHVYVAGAWTDLHVVAAPGMASIPEAAPDSPPSIRPETLPEPDPRYQVYRPEGQIYAVSVVGDANVEDGAGGQPASAQGQIGDLSRLADSCTLVAAGAAGLHVVRLGELPTCAARYSTDGFCMDVAAHGDRVYVAEGSGGLSIWRQTGPALLERIGRYRAPGYAVKQVVVPPPGKYALLHVGPSRLEIVDVSNPAAPVRVLEDTRLGLFYMNPLSEELFEGRFACCQWHVTGLYWYDLGSTPRFSGDNYPFRIGSQNGATPLAAQALVTCGGKYVLLDRRETRPPEQLRAIGIPGCDLDGKPSICGTRLYTSDRYSGQVHALDISDPQEPRLVGRLQLDEHPGIVVEHHGLALVPAGYQGLLLWNPAIPLRGSTAK